MISIYLFEKKKQRPAEKRKEKIFKIIEKIKKYIYLSMRVLVKYNKGLGMNLVSF